METFFTFWYKLVVFLNYSIPTWLVFVGCLLFICGIVYLSISKLKENHPTIAILFSTLFCCLLTVPIVSSLNHLADSMVKERKATANSSMNIPGIFADRNPTVTDSLPNIDTTLATGNESNENDTQTTMPTDTQYVSDIDGDSVEWGANITSVDGVLDIVSGQIEAKSVASADIFGKGGFAADIDSILSGVGGLKSGGDGGVGRKGVAGIGYGSGYGSGFGGGGGGVDDLLGGLMGGGGGGLELKKKGELKQTSPDFLKGGALVGGRSRASIQSIIMKNMAALRYAYAKRLREKPDMTGKIVVKFAIDEFGKVIFAYLVESTMSDSELESTILSRLKSWDFGRIDKPGDVTEITYPFVFTLDTNNPKKERPKKFLWW